MARGGTAREARKATGLRHWSLVVLGAWTVVIWFSRIRNIVDGDESLWWVVPAVVFLAGGVVTLAGFAAGARALVRPIGLFCNWTIGYWLIRTAMIIAGGHSLGFIAVHAVLAVVSAGGAFLVLRRIGWGRQPAAV